MKAIIRDFIRSFTNVFLIAKRSFLKRFFQTLKSGSVYILVSPDFKVWSLPYIVHFVHACTISSSPAWMKRSEIKIARQMIR